MTDMAPAGATPATACAKTGKKESFRRRRPSTGERGVMKPSPRADTGYQLSLRMGGLALLRRGASHRAAVQNISISALPTIATDVFPNVSNMLTEMGIFGLEFLK